jgi:hypothetical protein
MMFLRAITSLQDERDTWTARLHMRAGAEDVLEALTDPALIAAWAPVSFDVEGHAGGRLRVGARERVSGSIAGVRVAFDVEVISADIERLELVARGPVSLDVAYSFCEHDDGVSVEATVEVQRGCGLTASVLRGAVGTLLSAGALSTALRRVDASLSLRPELELVAA